MMRYSTKPRYQIFVKGFRFLSFAKNISKNLSKNIGGKCNQKCLHLAKQSGTNAIKLLQKT